MIDIVKAAYRLYNDTVQQITKGLQEKRLILRHDQYFVSKVLDFAYTSAGIKYKQIDSTTTSKPSKRDLFRQLWPECETWDSYKEVLRILQEQYSHRPQPWRDIGILVQQFVEILIAEDVQDRESQLKNLLWRFVRDLHDEPWTCTIRMDLQGITLEEKEMRLSEVSSLRQTTASDIEQPHELTFPDPRQMPFPYPSAIFEARIELVPDFNNGRQGSNDLQAWALRHIVLLRLYKVASISYQKLIMETDIAVENSKRGGTFHPGSGVSPLFVTYIESTETQKLLHFIDLMTPLLPAGFCYHNRQHNFLTIAYDRYSDALLEYNNLERQTTNAAMGLEAIFSNENAELAYKLRQRVARMISCLDYDPHQAIQVVKDAYNIRSIYAHGGLLDKKHAEKISTRYGSTKEFAKCLLDILRVSLVACISCKLEKNDFIQLLDEAMIDDKKTAILQSVLSPYPA